MLIPKSYGRESLSKSARAELSRNGRFAAARRLSIGMQCMQLGLLVFMQLVSIGSIWTCISSGSELLADRLSASALDTRVSLPENLS